MLGKHCSLALRLWLNGTPNGYSKRLPQGSSIPQTYIFKSELL
ncbi:MAG: hypothetical protein ACI30R_01900 [Sodaliphilus sp.]